MQLMFNKYILLIGYSLSVFLWVVILFFLIEGVADVIYLRGDNIEVSYSFSTIPFHFWILLTLIVGFSFSFSYLIGVKINITANIRKVISLYMPILCAVMGVFLGVLIKPIMVQHLVSHGYQLEKTIEASRPWYFDKDVYVKKS